MGVSGLQAFQEQVSQLLLRHRSLLDILSKLNQTNAAVHRAVVKSVTECGCVEVNGRKQPFEENMSLEDARHMLETHLSGHICEACHEVITEQLGRNLFYLSALCNVLDISLEEVLRHESDKCQTLGVFKMA